MFRLVHLGGFPGKVPGTYPPVLEVAMHAEEVVELSLIYDLLIHSRSSFLLTVTVSSLRLN